MVGVGDPGWSILGGGCSSSLSAKGLLDVGDTGGCSSAMCGGFTAVGELQRPSLVGLFRVTLDEGDRRPGNWLTSTVSMETEPFPTLLDSDG